MPQQEVYSGQIIDGLLHALRAGESGLSLVPQLIKRVIQDGMWREFVVERTGVRVMHERFMDFVTTKPLEGLGADLALLKRICAEHTDVVDLIDQEVKGKQGNPTGANQYQGGKDYIVILSDDAAKGTSRSYALRRLRKDRPDLHKKVIASEMSPHAAMVEAGFRPKTITVPLDVDKAAAALMRNFSGEEVESLLRTLGRLHSEGR
jgi:hypothetical protein